MGYTDEGDGIANSYSISQKKQKRGKEIFLHVGSNYTKQLQHQTS
jgi:hypothetical protein